MIKRQLKKPFIYVLTALMILWVNYVVDAGNGGEYLFSSVAGGVIWFVALVCYASLLVWSMKGVYKIWQRSIR